MPDGRQATEYNKIIGVYEDGSILILDEIFEYPDGFSGATYRRMGTLCKETIEAMNDPHDASQNIKDEWKQAVDEAATELSLMDYTKQRLETICAGEYYYGDDSSYREETQEAYDEAPAEIKATIDKLNGKKGEDFVDWDCFCCGRLGDPRNYLNDPSLRDTFYPELWKEIKKAERAEMKNTDTPKTLATEL